MATIRKPPVWRLLSAGIVIAEFASLTPSWIKRRALRSWFGWIVQRRRIDGTWEEVP